jgi:hypothetical protein
MAGSAEAPAKAPEPTTRDKELTAMRAAHDALGKRIDEMCAEDAKAKKDEEDGDEKKADEGAVEGGEEGGDKGREAAPDDKKDAKRKDKDLEEWAGEEKKEPNHAEGDKPEPMADDKRKDGEVPEAFKAHMKDDKKDAKKDAAGKGDHDPNLDATKDSRADSLSDLREQNTRLSRELARITRHMTRSDEDVDALSELHTEWDRVAQTHGLRASRPMYGETSPDYDRRMTKKYQKFSPTWKGHNLDEMPATVLTSVIAPAVRVDSIAAANRVEPGQEGILREVTETDRTGRRISKFIGPMDSWMGAFKMPPMRVRRINTQPSPY